MNTYEDLKKEIKSLEELRDYLETTEKFPEMGVDFEIILLHMQRVNLRIAELLNPNEGGMLVSEMVETPEKGDICFMWDDEIELGKIRVFSRMYNTYVVDEYGNGWINCKVIKKGDGNV
jgi:hypothetical protein